MRKPNYFFAVFLCFFLLSGCDNDDDFSENKPAFDYNSSINSYTVPQQQKDYACSEYEKNKLFIQEQIEELLGLSFGEEYLKKLDDLLLFVKNRYNMCLFKMQEYFHYNKDSFIKIFQALKKIENVKINFYEKTGFSINDMAPDSSTFPSFLRVTSLELDDSDATKMQNLNADEGIQYFNAFLDILKDDLFNLIRRDLFIMNILEKNSSLKYYLTYSKNLETTIEGIVNFYNSNEAAYSEKSFFELISNYATYLYEELKKEIHQKTCTYFVHTKECSSSEIRAAYKEWALKYYPDKCVLKAKAACAEECVLKAKAACVEECVLKAEAACAKEYQTGDPIWQNWKRLQ